LETVVLTETAITGGEEAVRDVFGGGGESLSGDGDGVGSDWVNIVHKREPVGEVAELVTWDVRLGIGVDGIVDVVLGDQFTVLEGAEQVGDFILLTIHSIEIKERGRVGADFEFAVNILTTGAKDTSVVLSHSLCIESVVGLFDGDEDVVQWIAFVTNLSIIKITTAMNTEEVVADELSEEGPEDVVTVRGENSLVTTEEFVGDSTDIRGENWIVLDSVFPPSSFGTTTQELIRGSPFAVEEIITSTIDLTNKETRCHWPKSSRS